MRIYLTASGLSGAPTAPVTLSGPAASRNSYTPSPAQSSARASRSHISPMSRPMFGMATWCRGWKAFGNSLGRTSNPQVSVAMAAISVLCSQPAVQNDRPGEASGADQDDVAAAHMRGGSLGGDGGLQVLFGDREPVGQLFVHATAPTE